MNFCLEFRYFVTVNFYHLIQHIYIYYNKIENKYRLQIARNIQHALLMFLFDQLKKLYRRRINDEINFDEIRKIALNKKKFG